MSKEFSKILFRKRQHFAKRLMERFALTMTNEEYLELSKKIEDYDPKPILIEDDGNSFHKVEIQGQTIIVLYDWTYHTLLTCYLPKWLVFKDGEWIMKRKSKSKTIRYQNRKDTWDLKIA